MNLGDGLQLVEVVVGALNLLVASLSTYLTWHAAKGTPLPQDPSHPATGLANDATYVATLAQLRHWEQHALPRYHPQALRPINDRRTTLSAYTRCLVAFFKRLTAGLVS